MSEEKQALFIQPTSLDLVWKEPQENLQRIEQAIKTKLSRSPDIASESLIFVFPELTLTGFITQEPVGLSLSPPDAVLTALQAIASKYKTALAVGFPEANPKVSRRPFNTFALIAPDGGIVSRYHKTHLFTVGKHPEAACYTAGDGGVVCHYRGWKIGFAICFDLRFPALFHEYAKAKVDLLLVGSCWIGGPHKSEQFKTLNSAYAILTQAYVASVNRSGKDPFYEYDGSQYVFSPFGENILRREPCELDPILLDDCRKMAVRPADRESYSIK